MAIDDLCPFEQRHTLLYLRLPFDHDIGVDVDRVWQMHRRTVHHETLFETSLHDLFGVTQVILGVDAFEILLFDIERCHFETVVFGKFDDIGQVVLLLCIVVGEFRQILFKNLLFEEVDTGIDRFDRLLFVGGILLFDDLNHFVTVDHDTSISGRVLHPDHTHDDIGIDLRKLLQLFGFDQRHIPV